MPVRSEHDCGGIDAKGVLRERPEKSLVKWTEIYREVIRDEGCGAQYLLYDATIKYGRDCLRFAGSVSFKSTVSYLRIEPLADRVA